MVIKDQDYIKKIRWCFIVLFFVLAVIVRLALLDWELPYYSVDENDVVEPALAFLSGDWEPHWYRYGPLFSYLLAFIYKSWMWIDAITRGWNVDDFFYAAFFEPTSFYVLARAFHGLIVISIAGVLWIFAKRAFDSKTAVAALILGLAPFLDRITNFTVRIDTLQGLFSLVSLFFATQFGRDRAKLRPYILSGIFAGFCIATKPLPGLLVLPSLIVGHFLSVWQQTANLSSGKRFKFALVQPELWVLLCSGMVAYSLTNPFSVLNFKGFLDEQYRNFAIERDAGSAAYYKRAYDFRWLVPKWGWPMVIAVAATLLTALRWSDKASRIIMFYIFSFCCSFIPFRTRNYWYDPVFPAIILLVSRFISGVSQSVQKYLLNILRVNSRSDNYAGPVSSCLGDIIMILLVIVLIYVPYREPVRQAYANHFSSVTPLEKRADYAAQVWIEKNLPAHSPILLIGRHAGNLPRLTADSAQVQAVWGEYFSYRRDENIPWHKAFENAYLRLQHTDKPRYQLFNIREIIYSNDPIHMRLNFHFRENMASIARRNGCKYIVVASWWKYKGTWDKAPGVKLIAQFNQHSGHWGDEVKIFEVLQ